MADKARTLLEEKHLVATRRYGWVESMAISDPNGVPLGSAHSSGNKVLLFLNEMSNCLLFSNRPYEVRDREDRPLLWIEQSGGVRRRILTVRRADRSLIGRLVGKTWGLSIRRTGYWLELSGERAGELVFDKPGYRILDSAGIEIGRTDKVSRARTGGKPCTTLNRADLPDTFASLAVAALIISHYGGWNPQ